MNCKINIILEGVDPVKVGHIATLAEMLEVDPEDRELCFWGERVQPVLHELFLAIEHEIYGGYAAGEETLLDGCPNSQAWRRTIKTIHKVCDNLLSLCDKWDVKNGNAFQP